MATKKLKPPAKSGWYWIRKDGDPIPCYYMGPDRFSGYEKGDEFFLPGGMGDGSRNGIYMEDVEMIGPEIEVPEF